MEEELSDHDLEDRMYAMLHYVDKSLANVNDGVDGKESAQVDFAPRSNVRRYWRTSGDQNSTYRKCNTPSDNTDKIHEKSLENNLNKCKAQGINQTRPELNPSKLTTQTDSQTKSVAKEEKRISPASDLSIFQQPVPKNLTKTIEILDNDVNKVVELQSSDEDEVIEIALPPKPTITIESSDEETLVLSASPIKQNNTKILPDKVVRDRDVSASPVPSIVSSVSDDFIRGDCIALNISSKHANNQCFDFSLHGSDLLDQTPSKKKKRKRNKDNAVTSTPIAKQPVVTPTKNLTEECFATPKSKAKKKKKSKSNKQTSKIIPMADVYDSDSNQSMIDSSKNQNSYLVTEKSLPNTDVYESDSNQSEQNKKKKTNQKGLTTETDTSDSSTADKHEETVTSSKEVEDIIMDPAVIDLTETEPVINENIVMANVMGFTEDIDSSESVILDDTTILGSTKIPPILCEDLDFDNLKGKDSVYKRHGFSLTTLRQEMEKFYNESWGGENFNHREIQKNMSRDKSLWVIDPKDRMPTMGKRKTTCNYCNRAGHRDDTCRMKPPICYMCGSSGHFEPRCPRKICVNCGSPNHMYSNMCRNCSNWNHIRCGECGQHGHPASHCPDFWRRYHNTIDSNLPLEENNFTKKNYQLYCSGCTRRGHLVHMCRVTIPFSGLPVNTPYVHNYRPVYPPTASENIDPNKRCDARFDGPNSFSTPRPKRQSKSPIAHETHNNKKRNMGVVESDEPKRCTKSPLTKPLKNNKDQSQKSQEFEDFDIVSETVEKSANVSDDTENVMPDFIPIFSSNHDKRGQVIQDNEVSDTSDVITSSRIYLAKDVKEAFSTDDGKLWLEEARDRNKISVDNKTDEAPFISVTGTVGNQEAFQSELKEWRDKHIQDNQIETGLDTAGKRSDPCNDIPKNRNDLIRKLTKALDSLKNDLGDPNSIYKELIFHQKKHKDILRQKDISTKQLANNRGNINGMLKKLNMVLLGQAGLANGTQHLNQLYSLQDKLINLRNKNVSKTMRDEVGEHFHCIFTALPRNDYVQLLNKYYIIKNNNMLRNTKNFNASPKLQKKTITSKQNVQMNSLKENNGDADDKSMPVKSVLKKLDFYHQRLLHTKPKDSILKKKRMILVNKLSTNIFTLRQFTHITPKRRKKVKRIEMQTQLFLSKV